MFDTVQTKSNLAATLFPAVFKEDPHNYEYECRDRTLAGACNRNINIAGAEVFKLFCGYLFDRRGYFGANAPYHPVRG